MYNHIATTYGLSRDSILNSSLFFFHVTDGLAPDIMHDILEGSLQYEAKELMKALVTDFKILSLNELSTRIESFPYGYSDLTNNTIVHYI